MPIHETRTASGRSAIPRGAVRGLSFDYGHVLGGLDLDELSARLAPSAPKEERATLRARMLAAMPTAYRLHDEAIARGAGHEGGWRALMATLVDAAASGVARDEMVDALWAAQPARNLWRDVPQAARDLLDELSSRGVPMVVTSNSEGRVAELLEQVGIARHFVAILDSGRLGFAKPDRRIFERAAAALSIPLPAMLHIGDSEAADVVGAKEAGAFAARYDGFVPGAAGRPTVGDARADTFPALRQLLFDALDLSVG